MEGYRRRDEAGTLSDGCRRTSEAIRRTVRGPEPGANMDRAVDDDPAAIVATSESVMADAGAVVAMVSNLEPYEAAVIGARFGLWGQPARTVPELAAELGCGHDRLYRAGKSGWAKILSQARVLGLAPADDDRPQGHPII
jgi:hypothetical protein